MKIKVNIFVSLNCKYYISFETAAIIPVVKIPNVQNQSLS